MRSPLVLITIGTLTFLLLAPTIHALNPSLDVSQYAHTAWTMRDGFSLGNIYAMAQTPDGYLWFGTEFGLFRFDGVQSTPWQPPAGQHLPDRNINSLLVTRDGTLWVGTFGGLVTWRDGKLKSAPALADQFVASLFEDREGTVWAGSLGDLGRLCTIQSGSVHCFGQAGEFGRAVWSLYEDSSGIVWAAAQSGLWRLKPGPARRYKTPIEAIGITKADDRSLLVALHGAGLLHLVGDKLESYPIRGGNDPKRLFPQRSLDCNRLLRDRDGSLWIGTVERGLIHIHHGRTDVFSRTDGLSGDVILALFEDREGNIWVASTGGLDRFRELPVTTLSAKQGLFSDATATVLAAKDGSMWVGSSGGLTKLQDGQATTFGKADGLPDDSPQSLYQDYRGRIWASSSHGLAYYRDGRFVPTSVIPFGKVHYITGDREGNLWLSEDTSLLHVQDGRLLERISWSALGHRQSAEALVLDSEGGLWIGFWIEGGVSYFKDHHIRKSYTRADGLGAGPVQDLQLGRDNELWASTQLGGLSRIKDGRIVTLTTKNGLPCDTINWTIEDDDHSRWLYTACGLVRIAKSELDAWIADPTHWVQTTVWDAADGVRLRSSATSEYAPHVTKSIDGKLWFATGEGIQVVDPHHLVVNKILPPIGIERIVADHKVWWEKLKGTAPSNLRLPALTRDVQIDYTALSLVAPDKVHFRYKLEGQDRNWREVVNSRQAQYTNLAPGDYRFRVIASNNSGLWNEQGDTLDFSVAPAYYQTNTFLVFCTVLFLLLLWAAYQLRIRQLGHQFDLTLEARVGERTRIARELHDTLLQSFHGLLLRFQTVSQLLPERPMEAKEKLAGAIEHAADAITEGRDAVQGLRSSTIQSNNLLGAIRTLGEELAADSNQRGSAHFRITVEGDERTFHAIVRDEIYKIAAEALRNAFRHAQAKQVEVEIRHDDEQFRLRVRDDGKGIDREVLSAAAAQGHYGLHGMRERATLIGGTLAVWSEAGSGTEVELRLPATAVYRAGRRRSWFLRAFAKLRP